MAISDAARDAQDLETTTWTLSPEPLLRCTILRITYTTPWSALFFDHFHVPTCPFRLAAMSGPIDNLDLRGRGLMPAARMVGSAPAAQIEQSWSRETQWVRRDDIQVIDRQTKFVCCIVHSPPSRHSGWGGFTIWTRSQRQDRKTTPSAIARPSPHDAHTLHAFLSSRTPSTPCHVLPIPAKTQSLKNPSRYTPRGCWRARSLNKGCCPRCFLPTIPCPCSRNDPCTPTHQTWTKFFPPEFLSGRTSRTMPKKLGPLPSGRLVKSHFTQ